MDIFNHDNINHLYSIITGMILGQIITVLIGSIIIIKYKNLYTSAKNKLEILAVVASCEEESKTEQIENLYIDI